VAEVTEAAQPRRASSIEALLRNRARIRERLLAAGATRFSLETSVYGKEMYLKYSFDSASLDDGRARHRHVAEELSRCGVAFEEVGGGVKFPFPDSREGKGVELAFRIVSEFRRFFNVSMVHDPAGRPHELVRPEDEAEILARLAYRSIGRTVGGVTVDGYRSRSASTIIRSAVDELFREGSDEDVERLLTLLAEPVTPKAHPRQDQLRAELKTILGRIVRPRTALSLRKAPDPPPDTRFLSHFHGEPYFEPGESWPLDRKTKQPLALVCQIVQGPSLQMPADIAVLQLFVDDASLPFRTEDPGWLVKTYAAINPRSTVRIAPPPGLERKKLLTVEAEGDGSLRDYGNLVWGPGLRPTRDGRRVKELCEQLNELVPGDAYEEAAGEHVRKPQAWTFLGGYPRWVQGEGPERRGYEFLIQIGSDPELDLRWGDSGAVYVFRHPRTGKCEFTLQSC
jgi:hypothetical protein